MNQEVENLINMALADGDVSEKERAIILRKAEAVGEDKDEIEMILDGRIALMKKEQAKQVVPPPPVQQPPLSENKSNKEGDLKKCPACGAPVQSFATKCADCGHEYKNIKSANSVIEFFEKINELESGRNEDTLSSSFGSAMSSQMFGGENKVDRQKRELISNFPIPNTREDILEFLTFAVPKAIESGNAFSKNFGQGAWEHRRHNQFAKVWKTKCEQIIMKARLSMKEDKKTLEDVQSYAKQLNIK